MASNYKIFWTEEAIRDLEGILDYLKNRWTQKEIDNFKNKLSKLLELIEKSRKYLKRWKIYHFKKRIINLFAFFVLFSTDLWFLKPN